MKIWPYTAQDKIALNVLKVQLKIKVVVTLPGHTTEIMVK